MICTSCNKNLPETSYAIRTDTGKLRKQCKPCRATIRKSHYENNKEHDLSRCKIYHQNNKERRSKLAKTYYLKNKECFKRRGDNWRKENPERVREISKESSRKFRQSDYGKFRSYIRSSARRYGQKFKISELNYTVDQFMQRIEFNFKDGMSWENYGEWEIDHTKPVKRFYDQGKMNINLVNALCNIKPLWKSENRRKSDKFIK